MLSLTLQYVAVFAFMYASVPKLVTDYGSCKHFFSHDKSDCWFLCGSVQICSVCSDFSALFKLNFIDVIKFRMMGMLLVKKKS